MNNVIYLPPSSTLSILRTPSRSVTTYNKWGLGKGTHCDGKRSAKPRNAIARPYLWYNIYREHLFAEKARTPHGRPFSPHVVIIYNLKQFIPAMQPPGGVGICGIRLDTTVGGDILIFRRATHLLADGVHLKRRNPELCRST